MIKNTAELEKALGLKDGALKAAIEATTEEVIDITALEIIPKADYITRIDNIKKEYGVGAIEVAVKDVKKKLSLEFEGKTIEKLVDAYKVKVLADAAIAPDKKVTELTKDLGTMTENYNTSKQQFDALQKTYKQKDNQRMIHASVMAGLPKDMIIPIDDAVELTLRKAAVAGIIPDVEENGGIVFKQNDAIMKNINLVPLKPEEVLKDYYTPYVKPVEGGGGGGDNAVPGKSGSLEAYEQEQIKKGIMPGTAPFNEEMQKRIKEKTLTV